MTHLMLLTSFVPAPLERRSFRVTHPSASGGCPSLEGILLVDFDFFVFLGVVDFDFSLNGVVADDEVVDDPAVVSPS